MFDIDTFNELFECGEETMLDYVNSTIISHIELGNNYDNRDYIKSLYFATHNLYDCVIATENTRDSILMKKFNSTFDKYTELRDMLFKELGIEYKESKYILKEVL